MIPLGEALLACTGLDAMLARKFRRPTMAEMERAQRLDREIRRQCRMFVEGSAFVKREKNPDPPFEWRHLLESLTVALEPAHIADCIGRFGEQQDLGLDYVAAAEPAMVYLRSRLPTVARRGLTNSRAVPPSTTELGDFRRVYTVATEPLSALRNLNAGILTTDEVTALETMYPATYAAMRTIFAEEVARRLSAHPEWEMAPRREAVAQIFLKTSTLDLELAAEIQAAYRVLEKEQEQPRGGGTASTDASKWLTQAQRIEAGEPPRRSR